MKLIIKLFLFSFMFSSLTLFANTDIKTSENNQKTNIKSIEPEEADIFNCTLECHRKCEKKEMEAVDCSNNSCKCAPG